MRGDWLSEAREYREIDRLAGFRARVALAKDEFLARARMMRNRAKNVYAVAYAEFRFGDAPYPEPSAALSHTAAQAVRLTAESIYRDRVGPAGS